MAQLILTEWSGPELIHVSPQQTIKSFGYAQVQQREPETYACLQRALDRAAEADGEVSSQRTAFPDTKAAAANTKEAAMGLGADLVGITHDPHRL